jgi:hypothetical protein
LPFFFRGLENRGKTCTIAIQKCRRARDGRKWQYSKPGEMKREKMANLTSPRPGEISGGSLYCLFFSRGTENHGVFLPYPKNSSITFFSFIQISFTVSFTFNCVPKITFQINFKSYFSDFLFLFLGI